MSASARTARIWSVLKAAVALAFVVREKLNLWQWSDKHVYLDAKWSARPGKYDSGYTAYMRPLCEALSDPRIRQVSVVKGAQIGFTTILANWIMYLVDMDPGPTLLCQPSRKIVRRYVKKELHTRFLNCPQLEQYLPANRREKFTAEEMYFSTMDFFATGVGSPAMLASLPIRYAAGDEVDKWDTEDEKEASRKDLLTIRLLTYEAIGTSKLVLGSTPTVPEMTISVEAAKGSQEHAYLPCPRCEEKQLIRFEDFEWKHLSGAVNADGSWNLDVIQTGTVWQCQNPKCRQFIEHDEKQWMIRHGETRSHNPNAPKDHRSFYIGGELGALTWGQLARKFLETHHLPGGLHNFHNSYLGRAWERKQGGATKKAIERLQEKTPIKYDLFDVQDPKASLRLPFRPAFITGHVDVQQTDFRFTLRAWLLTPDGVVVRALIALGEFVNYSELVDISNRVWTYDHGDGGPLEEFTLFTGMIDSGYRAKRGASVYNFVHEQGGRWIATKGGKFRGRDSAVAEKTIQFNYDGAAVEIPFMDYTDDSLKEHLYRFVIREQKFPYWLPARLPSAFVDQLTAERLIKVKDENGRTVDKWHSDIDPHFGDCEKLGELFCFSFSKDVIVGMYRMLDERRAGLLSLPRGR